MFKKGIVFLYIFFAVLFGLNSQTVENIELSKNLKELYSLSRKEVNRYKELGTFFIISGLYIDAEHFENGVEITLLDGKWDEKKNIQSFNTTVYFNGANWKNIFPLVSRRGTNKDSIERNSYILILCKINDYITENDEIKKISFNGFQIRN